MALFAHIDHVLVAEFDMDRGEPSIMYQYPLPADIDPQLSIIIF